MSKSDEHIMHHDFIYLAYLAVMVTVLGLIGVNLG